MQDTSTKVLLLAVIVIIAALVAVSDAQSTSRTSSDCILRQLQAGTSVLDVNIGC